MSRTGPRRWYVVCTQWVTCGWSGYRTADTREEACAKPCPKCEREGRPDAGVST